MLNINVGCLIHPHSTWPSWLLMSCVVAAVCTMTKLILLKVLCQRSDLTFIAWRIHTSSSSCAYVTTLMVFSSANGNYSSMSWAIVFVDTVFLWKEASEDDTFLSSTHTHTSCPLPYLVECRASGSASRNESQTMSLKVSVFSRKVTNI